jgi:hypothetical protein
VQLDQIVVREGHGNATYAPAHGQVLTLDHAARMKLVWWSGDDHLFLTGTTLGRVAAGPNRPCLVGIALLAAFASAMFKLVT